MKYKQYILALAFALVAIPVAVYTASTAQAVDLTNAELEARLIALTDRVEALEEELEDATTTIAALKTRISTLENEGTTDVDDTDADEDDETVTAPVRANGVAVCHNGKTQYVNVNSALTYKSQGATIGICAQERIKTQAKKQGTVVDDENEDEEEEDEDEEDEE